MSLQRPAAMLVAAIAVAGCAGLREDVREIRDLIGRIRGQQPAPPPPVPPPAAQIPAPAAAGMNLSGNCVGKDEAGYAENVQVEVARGTVRQLEARIDIPKRGSCTYRLADFRQTRETPYVELLARSGTACAVRMWQQDDRITLAATDCEEKCTRGASEYAWPVEFNTAGTCY